MIQYQRGIIKGVSYFINIALLVVYLSICYYLLHGVPKNHPSPTYYEFSFLAKADKMCSLHGEEKGSDFNAEKILKMRIITRIARLGRLQHSEMIERRFRNILWEENKILRLHALEFFNGLYEGFYLPHILLRYLADADPEVRIKTLEVLGRIKDKSTLRTILKVAKFDRDYYVNIAAIDALSSFNDRRLKSKLLDVLKHVNSDMREDIVFLLCSLADISDIPLLKSLLKDKSYIIKTYSAVALARLEDKTGIAELLAYLDDRKNPFKLLAAQFLGKFWATHYISNKYVEILKRGDLNERCMAIRILGKLSDEATLPVLIEQIKDEDERVRLKTAVALRDFGDIINPAILEAFLDLLEDGSEPVRIEAVVSLGELYTRRALRSILDGNPELEEVKRTFSLAMQNGDKASIELRRLLQYTGNSNRLKAHVIRSLGLLEDKSSLLAIIEALSDSDSMVRSYAVTAIGRIGEQSASSILLPLFDDASELVKIEAIWAAGLLGDKTLLEGVLKKIEGKDARVDGQALVAAFRLQYPQVFDIVIKGIYSDNVVTREACVQALGDGIYEHNIERSKEVLINALMDKSPLVRQAAIKSLSSIGSKTIFFNIIKMLNDRDREVRMEAYYALRNFRDHRVVSILRRRVNHR